jgi:serine/threonine-protein kinase RsbW
LGSEITPAIPHEEQALMTTVAAAGQAPGARTPAELITEYQRTYPGRADQVRNVRRDVAKHLGECPVTDDTVLIASEFGTNAILHSRSRGGHFTIHVALYHDCLRVECQDSGGPWRGRRRRQEDDRPHGLSIVEALTGPSAWGTETTSDGGRIVWATLAW